jgi:hypothetical protein
MKHFLHFIGFVILTVVAASALGVAVMLLWNWLVPAIFGFAAIGFWQALGLFALCRLLIGGLGFHKRGPGRHLHGHFAEHRDKWLKLTPEERREFIKRRRAFFGSQCHEPQPTEKQEENGNGGA